jgi:hypothetical protein
MMKCLVIFFTLFTLPALANPLIFADGALKAELTWIEGPRTPAVSQMKIEWKNGLDQTRIEPPGPMKVSLWMNMNGHGHGSAPTSITKLGQEPGVYQVSNMYFTMGGAWEVRINLKYSNSREETQILPLEIKGRGHH